MWTRISSGKCSESIHARMRASRSSSWGGGVVSEPESCRLCHTSSSFALIWASKAKCRKLTEVDDAVSFSSTDERARATFASSSWTNLRRLSSSSAISASKSRAARRSYSSAKLTKPIPVSNSIALLGFEFATKKRRISGGTKRKASIGPTVLPEEDDMAPLPLRLIHSYVSGAGGSCPNKRAISFPVSYEPPAAPWSLPKGSQVMALKPHFAGQSSRQGSFPSPFSMFDEPDTPWASVQ